MDGYCFKSELFEIEPGEDEETNPRCYGRQLSHWLKDKFTKLGYEVEEVIPEDWGWVVMCARKPYRLWIGVRCVEENDDPNPIPKKENIIWNCFVTAEVFFGNEYLKR